MKTQFKSQICTTREQSERLLALGLKRETADMAYLWYGWAEDDSQLLMDEPSIVHHGIMTTADIPAWSLHRLMELMLCKPWYKVTFVLGDDPYELMVRAMEWHKGYFNMEFLVDQEAIDEHCKGVMENLDYIREED